MMMMWSLLMIIILLSVSASLPDSYLNPVMRSSCLFLLFLSFPMFSSSSSLSLPFCVQALFQTLILTPLCDGKVQEETKAILKAAKMMAASLWKTSPHHSSRNSHIFLSQWRNQGRKKRGRECVNVNERAEGNIEGGQNDGAALDDLTASLQQELTLLSE